MARLDRAIRRNLRASPDGPVEPDHDEVDPYSPSPAFTNRSTVFR